MKVTFTIAKRTFEQGKTTGQFVEELVEENVAKFEINEATQLVSIYKNDNTTEDFSLYKAEGENGEQWFLMDIKALQIPMKVV